MDEGDELGDLWVFTKCRVQSFEGAREVGFFFEEDLFVEGFEGAEILFAEAPALQTDLVNAADAGGVAIDNGEGRDVLDNLGDAAGDAVGADAAELVNGAESGDDGVVIDLDVSGEGAVVREDDVVTDLAVVGDVGVGKEEVVRAETGGRPVDGATVDGSVLAKDIAITGDERGGFAGVFEILGFGADGGEGKEFVVLSEFAVAMNDDVRMELASISEADVGLDDAVGADFDVVAEFGLG